MKPARTTLMVIIARYVELNSGEIHVMEEHVKVSVIQKLSHVYSNNKDLIKNTCNVMVEVISCCISIRYDSNNV